MIRRVPKLSLLNPAYRYIPASDHADVSAFRARQEARRIAAQHTTRLRKVTNERQP